MSILIEDNDAPILHFTYTTAADDLAMHQPRETEICRANLILVEFTAPAP